MLVIALAAHAWLLFSISFEHLEGHPRPPAQSLDIVLVSQTKPKEQPETADFLSNQSQQGASETKGRQRPSSAPPLSQPRSAEPVAREPAQAAPGQQLEARRIVAQAKPDKPKKRQVTTQPMQHNAARTKPDIAQLLASTRQEINRLTAELDRNSRYSSQRLRHKTLNAATKEYKYASYLDAWRKKVERVGNLNYPDEALRARLRGDLLLHVALRADGSVQKVRVVRSSGHKILDDSAIRIVKLAAPFAPFPEEIRKEVDILDITRTWQFESNDSLFSSK